MTAFQPAAGWDVRPASRRVLHRSWISLVRFALGMKKLTSMQSLLSTLRGTLRPALFHGQLTGWTRLIG